MTGRNINVVVEGTGQVRYFLRCHLRNRNAERINFQLDFQQHLKCAGIPVAAVMLTDAGSRVAVVDGASWVLFEHLDGVHYDYARETQVRSAAQLLHPFHVAAQDFSAAPLEDDTMPDVRRWWTRGDEELAGLRAMFSGYEVGAELDFLEQWLVGQRTALPLEDVDQLPIVWLHGDYHGGNLLFSGDRVTGLVDFDVVHRGPRLEDIAYASFCLSRRDRGSTRIRPSLAKMFTQEFELSEVERRALPVFMVAVHARTAARYRVREREGTDPAAALRQHTIRMRDLRNQAE